MNKKSIVFRIAAVLVITLIALGSFAQTAWAKDPVKPHGEPPPPVTPQPTQLAQGGATPAPRPPTPGPGGTQTPAPPTTRTETIIKNITTHTVNFATDSFTNAWISVLTKAANGAVKDSEGDIRGIASASFLFVLNFSSEGIAGVANGSLVTPISSVWRDSLQIALILLPLVIVLNAALVFTQGLSAQIARAEMIEVLVRSLMTGIFAAGSYLIIDYIFKVGWGITAVILNSGTSGGAEGLAGAIVGSFVAALIGFMINPVASLVLFYLFLFIFIMAFMLLSALYLSYFAILILAIFCIAMAPIVIIVGSINQFRWLYGLWAKITDRCDRAADRECDHYEIMDSFIISHIYRRRRRHKFDDNHHQLGIDLSYDRR